MFLLLSGHANTVFKSIKTYKGWTIAKCIQCNVARPFMVFDSINKEFLAITFLPNIEISSSIRRGFSVCDCCGYLRGGVVRKYIPKEDWSVEIGIEKLKLLIPSEELEISGQTSESGVIAGIN